MRFNILCLFLLFQFHAAQGAIQIPIGAIIAGAELIASGISLGTLLYDLLRLKKEDNNSELAVETLSNISDAFEFDEYQFETKMNELHVTTNFQFFQETVGFPAHNVLLTAQKYFKSQTDFMEGVLLNECLKTEPYTHLNNLNTMIAEGWFLTQAELQNYRLPNVKSLQIRVNHAMKELVFSHFICMAVQGEHIEETVLTDVIRSSVSNITDTIDMNLKVIENLFFPKYVVKEVYKLIESSTFSNRIKDRNTQITLATLQMLKKTYGRGIISDSKKNSLFNKVYEIQVGDAPTIGKLPKNAVVDIKFKDYYILIYRTNKLTKKFDFSPYYTFSRGLRSAMACNDKTSCIVNACSGLEYCGVALYNGLTTFLPGNNIAKNVESLCEQTYFVITGLPLNSSTVVERVTPAATLQNKQQKEFIQVLRNKIFSELEAIKKRKRKQFDNIGYQVNTSTIIVASTTTLPLLLPAAEQNTSDTTELEIKFIQDVKKMVQAELKAVRGDSESMASTVSQLTMITFFVIMRLV